MQRLVTALLATLLLSACGIVEKEQKSQSLHNATRYYEYAIRWGDYDKANALRSPERSMLVVTHYQRLLEYIEPDYVHVLAGGRIVRSGDRSLALELEEKGYGWIAGA